MILDGYRSYLIYGFYKYTQKHKNEQFALPIHFIYLMQLLDINYFQLYNYYYNKAIDEIMQTRISKFNKLNFLASFTIISAKTFKKSTIFSAFRTDKFNFW